MSEFNAADYGITWPTTPRDIVAEALREYLSDGEGVDGAVFASFVNEVRAPLEARVSDLEKAIKRVLDVTDSPDMAVALRNLRSVWARA